MENARGELAVISGFSGVGKGTAVKQLLQAYPDYVLSVSATTRDMRPGEIPGVSYHYITNQAFEERIARGEFLEWARYVDHYYGTLAPWVMDNLSAGRSVILEIEAEGAFQVKRQYPEALLIFMLPPSMKVLEERLIGRGTEAAEVIQKRLKKAAGEELERAREYDFLIVNDDLDTCVAQLHRLIQTRQGVKPAETDLLDRLAAEAKEWNP